MKRLKFLRGKADSKKKNLKSGGAPVANEEDDVLAHTFKKFDQNGNGALSEQEMFAAMQDIMREKVTRRMVRRVMNEIDVSGNGFIELEEFYDFFEKCDALAESGEFDLPEELPSKAVGNGASANGPATGNTGLGAEVLALLHEMKKSQEAEAAVMKAQLASLHQEVKDLRALTESLKEKSDRKNEKRQKGEGGAEKEDID